LYVAKQAEKINQYQEEITDIVEQLANYKQKSHHQELMIAKLSKQLESSQEKATKLEKEYTELQAVNQAKNQEILDKKQQIQELNIRLHRQQQHLLEQKNTNYEKTSTQPIKAWSANSIEVNPLQTTALASEINQPKTTDWPAPAIAKKTNQVKSLAAVKLPQFPRRAEAET
jgi:chromosome segregation ATPase